MKIYSWFRFEAGHSLPFVPKGHKCGRVHGHGYRVRLTIEGPVASDGFVVDFAVLKRTYALAVDAKLDHRYLNKVIKNPTAEGVAEWIAFAFQREMVSMAEYWPKGVRLAVVEVLETSKNGCVYEVPE